LAMWSASKRRKKCGILVGQEEKIISVYLTNSFHICKAIHICDEQGDVTYGRAWVDIHSFSNLSDDRSNASSKTVPPHSAI
jgi:hypothetical protein